MSDSSYPTIKESVSALAELWVKWNNFEVEGGEVMSILKDKGYFLEEISKAWANSCDIDQEETKRVWVESYNKRNNSSPTTVNEDDV